MMTTTRKVYFQRDRTNRRVISTVKPAQQLAPVGRVPRVSRLMALAIHFDELIRRGTVSDQSELARLCYITQPRATQIMNLNHLAPCIVEELLHLPLTVSGRDRIHERMLRPIAAQPDWRRQIEMWRAIHERLADG